MHDTYFTCIIQSLTHLVNKIIRCLNQIYFLYINSMWKKINYIFMVQFFLSICMHVELIDFFPLFHQGFQRFKTTLQFIIIWQRKKHKMSDKESPDSLDNSLNGEFPLQEKDDGELNMSVGSSVSDSETEKKVRTESPSSPRIPPAFMVAGIWQYDFIWLYSEIVKWFYILCT